MQLGLQNIKELWVKLRQRLEQADAVELEQAVKLRLVMGFGLLLYFCFPWHDGENLRASLTSLPSLVTMTYYCFSLLIFIAIIINPKKSPLRRVMGSFLDLTALSLMMFGTGSESIFMFALYLWIVLGNGFRYGAKYLYFSLFIALVGFTVAVSLGDYWQTEETQSTALSLFLVLLIVPLYSVFLLNKLHAAIASAKYANEAKSHFLASMSHELRTPLNGVIGIADLLGETKLDRQQHEFVNIMRGSANSLLGLVDDVLDISKIEAGKINIASESFDLHLLVNTIIQVHSKVGSSKGLLVSCHIDAEIPFLLEGDQQHLRQILVNLIGNAVKFTDEGTIKLFVSPTDNSLDSPRIRFEIQDTGIGIPEIELANIFDEFAQVNSNKYGISGTGLGTTISKELVELMGGEIGVESQSGLGSTFWFELPFKTAPYEDVPLSDKHILLLTTEETVEYISPSLESWGVTYDHAFSSARAFSLLMQADEQSNNYQIMLVEQSCIAEIDPVKFSQMIKMEQTLGALPLVLINSEYSDAQNIEIQQHYITTITNLQDKRLLFNAIHAAQSVNNDNKKVVTLADHFPKNSNVKQLNILIAEDNRVNQQVLEGVLKNAGHGYYLAETGEQALDIITEKTDEIDMVILDMNMPELTGIEVVQAMQYLDTTQKTPIIMLTADATPEAKENCLNAGADIFLTKPINTRRLLDVIAELSATLPEKTIASTAKNKDESIWIDTKVLDELILLGGGKPFLHRLIKGFKEDGDKHLAIIKRAVDDDYFVYRESLHALKGSAIELGANKLVKLCIQCESLKPFDIGTNYIFDLAEQVENTFVQTIESLEDSLVLTQVDNK